MLDLWNMIDWYELEITNNSLHNQRREINQRR